MCTWFDMEVLEKSQGHGLSPASGLEERISAVSYPAIHRRLLLRRGRRRHGGSEMGTTLDVVPNSHGGASRQE